MQIDEAKARYAREREKRLREEGLAQYQQLGDYDLDRDPWADPSVSRDPIDVDTEVVILGGGFAGMLAAVNLLRRGITDFRIVEKGGDFGGTWYWNRYPGCMCDVESYIYLPLLEETGYMPTERYASASEIFAHCQRIGQHFGLYEHALFQTQVESLVWDDDACRWDLVTTQGDKVRTKFFVAAGGLMHKAKLPGIAGIEQFRGQGVPHLALGLRLHRRQPDRADGPPRRQGRRHHRHRRHRGAGRAAAGESGQGGLRLPAHAVRGGRARPAPDRPGVVRLPRARLAGRAQRNFTEVVTGGKPDRDLVADGWSEVLRDDTQRQAVDEAHAAELEAIDFEVMEGLRRRVDEVIDDPALAEQLKPWYGKHCKRICFHDEYLQAFNQPNVHLVDTDGYGVREISPAGPVVDGTEYPLDLLVFASGFEITTGLVSRLGFDPVGRDGVRLSERWHDGTHSLHGILTADLPNFMVVSFIQAGFGLNFVHFLSESTKHIAWLVDHCATEGITSIEATVEGEDEWLERLWSASAPLARYNRSCTPSYGNSEGARTTTAARSAVFPGPLMDYAAHLDAWREAGDLAGTRLRRTEAP